MTECNQLDFERGIGRLRRCGRLEFLGPGDVGDCSGNFQDPVIRSGTEVCRPRAAGA
jgi:hypothetical protein